MGLLPAAAAIIAMLIFIRYPLSDDKFREIRDETEARKAVALEAELESDPITPV
jgi:glucuronide carrier protein